MHVRTDDEVYRVDSVWLGPPKATLPWRARYSAYAMGLGFTVAFLAIERQIGIPFGFFSSAWALLVAVVLTRFIGRRINSDRPLTHVLTSIFTEIRTPRLRTGRTGGAPRPRRRQMTVRPELPRPVNPQRQRQPARGKEIT